jgi:YebC/PmpR family DNA-binding regulatory protein
MPKDNIERAIKRGTGEAQGEVIEELQYEGFGSGGTAILVDVMTDNRNRTAGEIRKIFERNGGKMGSAGNVSFLFERKGLFAVPTTTIDEDTLMAFVIEAGADDLKRVGDHFEITCDPAVFRAVQMKLEEKKVPASSAELMQLPKVGVDVDTETGKKVLRLMEALDDHDDVQHVYSNVTVTDAMMAAV